MFATVRVTQRGAAMKLSIRHRLPLLLALLLCAAGAGAADTPVGDLGKNWGQSRLSGRLPVSMTAFFGRTIFFGLSFSPGCRSIAKRKRLGFWMRWY